MKKKKIDLGTLNISINEGNLSIAIGRGILLGFIATAGLYWAIRGIIWGIKALWGIIW